MATNTKLTVKTVPRSNKNLRLFREVSRDCSGENFVPDDEEETMYFGYIVQNNKDYLVGVGSCLSAEEKDNIPSTHFASRYDHKINYLFVRSWYQNSGYGGVLLKNMEEDLFGKLKRPFVIQSARKAADFFIKRHNYYKSGNPIETVCGGSPLFRTLIPLKKEI